MIREGLERHALQYLVSPLISIDEFESKIDDRRVIVSAFFVKDFDPANDLSTFIEKSSIRPLDTEVSPAPTDDGYYVVFVEMGRNDEFPKRIIELTQQVSNLCAIEEWQFKPYGGEPDTTYDLKEQEVRDHVNLDPDKIEVTADDRTPDEKKPEQVNVTEAIGQFLRMSLLESIEIRGQYIRFTDGSDQRIYRITDWRHGQPSMPIMGFGIGESILRESMQVQRLLGSSYVVDGTDAGIAISDGNDTLILAVDN